MLCVAPDFSMYKFYSSICEVECDTFIKSDDLSIDTDALIEKVNRDNIKLLLFSNPCNPTGQGMTAEDARRLVTSVNALVILDEAYMDFWDQSLINEVEKYSNLIIFRTASKAVGSAALRLGFAVANETISRAVKAVKSPYNVNTFSQVVGSIIYKNKDYLKNRQKQLSETEKSCIMTYWSCPLFPMILRFTTVVQTLFLLKHHSAKTCGTISRTIQL